MSYNNKMSYTFDKHTIDKMNYNSTWKQSITYGSPSKNNEYKLYATGNYNLTNGRQYIALDKNIDVTDRQVRRKYNLM